MWEAAAAEARHYDSQALGIVGGGMGVSEIMFWLSHTDAE